MRTFDKPIKSFDRKELSLINFGNLEGEKDKMLEESFLKTSSISKILSFRFNYVLSPKGGGKSAVFRIINEKVCDSQVINIDYSKYSIVGVNSAFGFEEEDYLNPNNFKLEENRKSYAISWGVYLAHTLIDDILSNHSDKIGFEEFRDKLKKITGFKEKFELFGLMDYVNQSKLSLKFNIQGQDFSVTPKVSLPDYKNNLLLNKLFIDINKFYKENNLTSIILIDRLDNFVRKESYEVQKNYIQGLIDCIEELSNQSNIHPMLLLRTDLFYSHSLDYEYDKAKERTRNLVWSDDEILGLIVYRLLANKYIKDNYLDYFNFIQLEGQDNETSKLSKAWKVFIGLFGFKEDPNARAERIRRNLQFASLEKYLCLFFPRRVELFNNMPFCSWLFEYLKDANGFLNPRILIYFLNELIEAQVNDYEKMKVDLSKEVEASADENYFQFDIFNQNIIPEVYRKVQIDELRNIYLILKSKEFQTIFKEINERTSSKSRKFNYGDFNVKKMQIPKEEYDRLLKYLTLLGYCKDLGNQVYEVPELYFCKMSLQSND